MKSQDIRDPALDTVYEAGVVISIVGVGVISGVTLMAAYHSGFVQFATTLLMFGALGCCWLVRSCLRSWHKAIPVMILAMAFYTGCMFGHHYDAFDKFLGISATLLLTVVYCIVRVPVAKSAPSKPLA